MTITRELKEQEVIKKVLRPIYKTSDGQEFIELEDAIETQQRINLKKWVKEVGFRNASELHQSEIIDAILKHAEEFKKILLLDIPEDFEYRGEND